MRSLLTTLGFLALSTGGPALAAGFTAQMHLATPTGPGEGIGSVTMTESPGGVRFEIDLHGLPPGPHGFHVHANPSCAPGEKDGKPVPAGGAGAHLDPTAASMHMGPEGMGHLGDLPLINVGPDGTARAVLTAPHIRTLDALKDRALMIHAGGDNYSDQPAPLGGGGPRLACGVVGG
jgi:Cu-Zn family superoxide dismutase